MRTKPFFYGLRFRIFLLLLLVISLPVGMWINDSYASLLAQRRQAEKELQNNLLSILAYQESLMDYTSRYLAYLSTLEEIQKAAAGCDSLLRQFLVLQPAYLNSGVVDLQGNVRCSALPLQKPVNVADTSWFLRALQTEGMVAGDFQIGRITGKPSLILAYPILVAGEKQGFVTVSLDLGWLHNLASRLSLTERDVYLVLDAQGTVLVRWPGGEEWSGKSVKDHEIGRKVFGAESPNSGLFESHGLDGVQRIYAFAPWRIGERIAGYLILGFESARMYGTADHKFRVALLVSGVTVLISLLLAWGAGYFFLLRHVDDLKQTVEQLAEGKLSARSRLPYGISELSDLARQVDYMASRLEEVRLHLDAVLEHAPVVFFVLDSEGRFLLSQGKALESLGLRASEVVGRSALEMYAAYPMIVENLQKALAGEECSYTIQIDSLAFYTHCIPIRDARGKVHRVVGIAIEVSDLERARQQLELQAVALQNASDAIAITDSQGGILWVNRAFSELSGYNAEELIGRTMRVLKSGMHDQAYYRQLWETILSGQVWRADVVNRRKDGSLYEAEQVITPVRDHSGKVVYFVTIQREVTERRQAMRLIQAEAKLAEMLGKSLELQPLLDGVLEAALSLTPAAEKGSILLLGADNRLHIRAVHGYYDPAALGSSFPLTSGYAAKAFRERRPLLIADVPADETVRYEGDIAELSAVQSAIVAPLIVYDRVIGTISLDNVTRKQAFTQKELDLLERFAGRAALLIENLQLIRQTRQRLRRLETLRDIDLAISSTFDMELVLMTIVRHVITQLGIHAAGVWLYHPEFHELHFFCGEGFRSKTFTHRPIRLGRDLLGEALLKQEAILLHQITGTIQQDVLHRLFPNDDFQACYALPLVAKTENIGVLAIFHRQPNPFAQGEMSEHEWVAFLETLAGQASIAIDNIKLFESTQRMMMDLLAAYDATIEGWSKALEMRDYETYGHTQRVLNLTLRLAKAMEVPGKEWPHIRRGVLLHDIGKIAVPDEILLKPGPLTPQEWEIMRRHPTAAYEMLKEIDYLKPALDIPYCHHEKWDGSGYPRGLKGEQIPLAARIFAIVDVWDALTNDRPYRKALSPQEALEYIRSQSGKHFDPKVVEAFVKVIEEDMRDGRYPAM